MAEELGYPSSWGDSSALPPKGGKQANKIWNTLGLDSRASVGGLPCEIVHGGVGRHCIEGGVGGSCVANAAVRGAMGFVEGLAIYGPVSLYRIFCS